MSLESSDLFELYSNNLLVPDLILDPVKSTIAADGDVVIERRQQEFFIKNIATFSYNVKVVPQNDKVVILNQPNVIHPTRTQAFSLEFRPSELENLEGLLHFEIDPI